MRSSYPQTIDVSTEPVAHPSTIEPQVVDSRSAINQTLGADAFLLTLSLLIGIVCGGVIGDADASRGLNSLLLKPLPLFVCWVCSAPSLVFLISDTIKASHRYPARMPFGYPLPRIKAVYARRIHIVLLAIYFSAMVAAFCWSVPSMPVVSRLFVAAVFAIALYALGQSIASRRKSLMVTGALFLMVLIATQFFVLVR